MTIGERIKDRRKELNLTVDDMTQRLNISRATFYRYESNEIEKLPATILEPLSKVLETTPAYLMGWQSKESEKKDDTIADITLKLIADNELLEITKNICKLSKEQRVAVQALLSAFNSNK